MSIIATLALSLLMAEAKPESAAKTYTLDASGTTTKVKVGANGQFKLHIKPAKGYKVSADAPLKVALSAEKLKLKKPALGKQDVEKGTAEAPKFAVGFDSSDAGQCSIEADATFFICSDTLCEKKTEKVTVAVDVTK